MDNKKKKLITGLILAGIGLTLIIVGIILFKVDADLFKELKNWENNVRNEIITVEQFNAHYAPIKSKSNILTLISIMTLVGGVVCLVYCYINISKSIKGTKTED